MTEWRSIPEWEGFYEVARDGKIRNAATGQIRKASPNRSGHMRLTLYPGNKMMFVHRAVAAAFLGNPEGQLVRHLDGNPGNNNVENLAIGGYHENAMDSVRHGTHAMARKTHCKHGHPFNAENTYRKNNGGRGCLTCSRQRRNDRYRRLGN